MTPTTISIFMFVFIFAVIGGICLLTMIRYSNPSARLVYKRIKTVSLDSINRGLEIEKYFFFFRKAVAYRSLYSCHIFFFYFFRGLGIVATMITVYTAFQYHDYILLSALVAAICDIVSLIVPFDKLASTYVKSARIMEIALMENYEKATDPEITSSLNNKYQECENIIENKFM